MGQHMYNGKTADELVVEADEAIRGLNHITINLGGVRYPSEIYEVLGGVTSLVGKLPQLLQQLERPVQRWVDQDLVAIDAGEYVGDPVAAAAALSVHLIEQALPAIDQLHRALEHAQLAITYASYTGDVDEHGDATAPSGLAPRVVDDREWGVQFDSGIRIAELSSDGDDRRERSPASLLAASACRSCAGGPAGRGRSSATPRDDRTVALPAYRLIRTDSPKEWHHDPYDERGGR